MGRADGLARLPVLSRLMDSQKVENGTAGQEVQSRIPGNDAYVLQAPVTRGSDFLLCRQDWPGSGRLRRKCGIMRWWNPGWKARAGHAAGRMVFFSTVSGIPAVQYPNV